jgi:O-antigen/teichoic acid export membrane protein
MEDEPRLLTALDESALTGVHVAALRLTTYAVAFGASVMIGRVLGPDGRGRYAVPMVIVGIALTVGSLGLEHAQVFLAARGASLQTLWANGTFASIGMSFVAVAGLETWLFLAPDAVPVPRSWLYLAVAQLPLLLQTLFWTNLLQLSGRLRQAVAANLAAISVQAVAVVWLISNGALSPFRVLLASAAANALVWCFTLSLGSRAGLVSWTPDMGTLARALRFGLKAHAGIVFAFLLFRVDQMMVETMIGVRALGLYSLAVAMAEILWLLSDPFAAATLRHQVAAEGDDDVTLGFGASRMALLAVGGAAVLCWVIAPLAIEGLYGAGFAGAIAPFRLLLPGVVALAVQRPLGGLLLKRGRAGSVAILGASALLTNVLLNLLLIPRFGLVGASLSSTFAYTTLMAAYVGVVVRSSTATVRDLLPMRCDVLRLRAALTSTVRVRRRLRDHA